MAPVIDASHTAPRRDYALDPVVVVADPKCDPYLSLSWCAGEDSGDCMSGAGASTEWDALSGCPAPGTGIGPGGGPIGDGSGGGGAPTSPLPGDSDGDGDTWDDGPGAWILCISSILGAGAGAGASYFALEDYYYKVDRMNAARVRMEYYRREFGQVGPGWLEVSNEYDNAEREARIAGGLAATGIGVSLAALIGAGVVCAPLIIAPTP